MPAHILANGKCTRFWCSECMDFAKFRTEQCRFTCYILKLQRSYNRRNTGGVLDLHVGRWLVTIALAINYYVSTCGFNAQLLNSFYLVESTSVLFFFFNKTSGCRRKYSLFFSFLLLMVINFQLASGIRSLFHIFWGGGIISGSSRPC